MGLQNFNKADKEMREAADKARYFQYEEAMNLLSGATSSITTSGQKAAKVLKRKAYYKTSRIPLGEGFIK